MKGEPPDYETVIGVEVHVQLRTETKMFCGCSTEFGAPPNTNVCPVCLGLPGALPVPNENAVRLGVRAALALGCRVHRRSEWARKNYFYPDLPKGYQITQYAHPLATDGQVVVRLGATGHATDDATEHAVGVRRLHLEEDAGKSVHDRFPGQTAVDLNRCGVPLAEIVSDPDLRSPGEARAFLTRLKQLLEHYAGVSDCNMEEGSLRVDANLSVRPTGDPGMGTKTEIKNLNSFRHVEKALAFERRRQVELLGAGERVRQETRLYDPGSNETRTMRGKEEATDYRYFPEPDLPLLITDGETVERQRARLPELPHRVESRLMAEYDLSENDAEILAAYPGRWRYFLRAAGDGDVELAKTVANLLMGPVAEELNRRGEDVREDDLLPARALTRVAELRLDGTLSSTTTDRTLELMLTGEEPPEPDAVVESRDLAQVRDEERLAEWVREAVNSNPEEARRYASGEEKLLGFFMGQVMRIAGGKADPEKARELLRKQLAQRERSDRG